MTDNVLTITTTVDKFGEYSFDLEGTIIDHDGKPFTVGEFGFNITRIRNSAHHYKDSFDNVTIDYITNYED
jgi:hypothetical protein